MQSCKGLLEVITNNKQKHETFFLFKIVHVSLQSKMSMEEKFTERGVLFSEQWNNWIFLALYFYIKLATWFYLLFWSYTVIHSSLQTTSFLMFSTHWPESNLSNRLSAPCASLFFTFGLTRVKPKHHVSGALRKKTILF